ncbi:MAG: hypothetical protein HDR56_05575 [Treponema sp.]|nr:hypothetical protein [Treponema sp.]MBD5400021.1 hypothetical protein [Treponema sp.]MBD5407068.1 hypothetical protein [Treponema sp.]MBD5442797.1 hypothetical protein [Treponema sp.]
MNAVEHKNKIAIFDLDGTLWNMNSHIMVLNSYFNTKFYTSVFYKGLRHFFPKKMYEFICSKYRQIPKEYVLSFEPEFDETILSVLNEKRKLGYFVLILSNAPYEIVFHASERIGIPFLVAPIGGKKEILDKNYSYDFLFVCTDNMEDIDLLKASNERKIIWNKYNSDFFVSHGFEKEI